MYDPKYELEFINATKNVMDMVETDRKVRESVVGISSAALLPDLSLITPVVPKRRTVRRAGTASHDKAPHFHWSSDHGAGF